MLAGLYRQLEREAAETLARDGIDPRNVRLVREADVRYVGQSMEVRVQVARRRDRCARSSRALADAFHAAHEKAFGYSYRGKQKVELVNCCVSGFGVIDRPALPKLAVSTAVASPKSRRRVFFGGSYAETSIYERAALAAGQRIDGPAVVEEFGSTTVVFPGQRLAVDPHGIMIVRRADQSNSVERST